MKCENCGNDHPGIYASGRFCSERCSRLYSILKNQSKSKFIDGICKNCNEKFQVKRGTPSEWYICNKCKELFCGSKKRISERKLIKLICSCGKEDNKLVPIPEIKRYSEIYKCNKCKSQINRESKLKLTENLTWNQIIDKGKRRRILLKEYNYTCQSCKNSLWLGKQIPLEVEHIDGNNSNWDRLNVTILCPNCHSLTPTFRNKNRRSDKINIEDNQIIEAIKLSSNIRQLLKSLELTPKAANYERIRTLMFNNNLKFIDS